MTALSLLRFITKHPVNRRQRIASLRRFARWQIGSRLAPGAILYDWINGARVLVRHGETGFTQNIYTGLHEFSDMGYLLHVMRAEDVFADVGANVGSYTVLAGAAVGASGYAFEPVPKTFVKLMENIRLNHMEHRVKAFNVGLAQADGTMRFTNDLDTVNHVVAAEERSTNFVEVDVVRLDNAVSAAQPNLMKVDVEGYETNVLAGAERMLNDPKLHSIIIELNGSGIRYGFDDTKILGTLLDAGFRPYAYDPLSRILTNLNNKNKAEGNTIFIRNEDLVRARIANAQTFNVLGVNV